MGEPDVDELGRPCRLARQFATGARGERVLPRCESWPV